MYKKNVVSAFDRTVDRINKTIQDINNMIQEYHDYGCLSDKWYESEQKQRPELRVIKGGKV